jgi:putative nucleotidyltransferase with HDIG domain
MSAPASRSAAGDLQISLPRPQGFEAPASRAELLPVVLACLAATVWFAAPAVVDAKTIRPAVAFACVLLAIISLARAARHTEARERRGWTLAFAGSVGALLPFVGSVAGIAMGVGILLIAGDGWLRDRPRMLDGAVALTTVLTAAAAYLYPEIAQLSGLERAEGYVASTQVVLAFACVVAMAYRTGPRTRPDAWLLGAGFALGTIVGMPALVTDDLNHASTWVPVHDWEVALPMAALMIAAAGDMRRRNPARILTGTGTLTEPNVALVGDATLGFVILAFALAPPPQHAALALLLLTLGLRHARSRLVENATRRWEAAAREEADRRLGLYRASFLALATAIEARDGYTHAHSEQTVFLVEAVARELELPDEDLAEAKTAALLHDVGKIGIPDSVLHKPGPLDEDEWRIMREHPVIGERILRQVPGLERVAAAIRHEHERWDGDGYPDGISGEAIPLESRIVLVCDAYHAMTSDRPYRAKLPREQALAELRRCAGTQFDPRVVDALCAVASRA